MAVFPSIVPTNRVLCVCILLKFVQLDAGQIQKPYSNECLAEYVIVTNDFSFCEPIQNYSDFTIDVNFICVTLCI